MVEQAFNPSTQEAEADDLCELKASLSCSTEQVTGWPGHREK